MIINVQNPSYNRTNRSNMVFGSAVRGFSKSQCPKMKMGSPVKNTKWKLFTTIKDIFFEMFPGLDPQFKKHMANLEKLNKFV